VIDSGGVWVSRAAMLQQCVESIRRNRRQRPSPLQPSRSAAAADDAAADCGTFVVGRHADWLLEATRDHAATRRASADWPTRPVNSVSSAGVHTESTDWNHKHTHTHTHTRTRPAASYYVGRICAGCVRLSGSIEQTCVRPQTDDSKASETWCVVVVDRRHSDYSAVQSPLGTQLIDNNRCCLLINITMSTSCYTPCYKVSETLWINHFKLLLTFK